MRSCTIRQSVPRTGVRFISLDAAHGILISHWNDENTLEIIIFVGMVVAEFGILFRTVNEGGLVKEPLFLVNLSTIFSVGVHRF